MSDETQSLRRCVTELAALSALAAGWGRSAPQEIAGSLANLLCRALPLTFGYVRLSRGGMGTVEAACGPDGPLAPDRVHELGRSLEPALHSGSPDPRLTVSPLGRDGDGGVIVTSWRQPASPTDQLVLGAAVNQVTAALQQRLVEEELRRSESEFARVEKALRQQSTQFATLVEHIPDIVARLDRDLRYLYIGPAVRAITGRSADEYIGKPRTNLGVTPEVAEARERVSRKVFETGEKQIFEFPIDTPAGPRFLEGRYIPEFGPDGSVETLMTLTRDVTERKRADERLRESEERLREADRRKDEFLATLAHELRNPLAPIRTGLQVLKMANHDPEALAAVCASMERQTLQLITLVDDLMDVSRITRGRLQLRKERVELAAIVQSAVETSKPQIDEAGHHLTVTLPDQPLHVDADRFRLSQVLSNLLNNAAKYTPPGGRIRLWAEHSAGEIVVTVQDSGIGIPAHMLDRVFEMFTQIDRPLEKGHTGLGIGLTLVKSLVEMHGGSVRVRSEGENRGSTFSIHLPIATGTAAADSTPLAAAEETARRGARRVLVVDDNEAAVEMLALMVKMLGHDVRTAGDGEQALEVGEDFHPEVVLMDLGMPRMSGYEAATRMRATSWGKDAALIALTGWGQQEAKQRTEEAGFDHHLVKPANPEALQALLADPSAVTTRR